MKTIFIIAISLVFSVNIFSQDEVKWPHIPIEESNIHVFTESPIGTPLFIGLFNEGSMNTPIEINSIEEFKQNFPTSEVTTETELQINLFFQNGGTKCFVSRLRAFDNLSIKESLELAETNFKNKFDMVIAPDGLNASEFEFINFINQLLSFAKTQHVSVLSDLPLVLANLNDVKTFIDKLNVHDRHLSLFFSRNQKLRTKKYFGSIGALAGVISNHELKSSFQPIYNSFKITLSNLITNSTITSNDIKEFKTKGINVVYTVNNITQFTELLTTEVDQSSLRGLESSRLTNHLLRNITSIMNSYVFEANEPKTWSEITLVVNDFLFKYFQLGFFKGQKPNEAFYVKCDATTNTLNDIKNNLLNLIFGISLIKPAEFMPYRIQVRHGS